MEEFRDPALEEWNFKKIAHDHLANLLKQQRIYWKQRGKINWATLGEENTRFFHATATIRHNKNSIMVLKDKEGVEEILSWRKWEDFQERMGTSEFSEMHFNLNDLLQPIDDLDNLVSPFSKEEIDDIVKSLPNRKSPFQMASIQILSKSVGVLSPLTFMIFVRDFLTSTSICTVSITPSLF
jgi:hypothetical protein